VVVPQPGVFELTLLDETRRELPAIEAWRAADPGVRLSMVDADGRFYVGARVTDLGNGNWRYEYAIQNLNSHEAARSFTVPIAPGAQITNLGFHDVDYHSGEPFDGTNWPSVHDAIAETVSWSTATFQQDPNANALRWGTLYNFRFDADHPPGTAAGVIGLFRGELGYNQVLATTLAPHACAPVASEELGCTDDIDDDCDGLADCADFDCCTVAACADGIDADGDLVAECDCNDADATVWSTPGEARNLVAAQQAGTTLLSWSPPSTAERPPSRTRPCARRALGLRLARRVPRPRRPVRGYGDGCRDAGCGRVVLLPGAGRERLPGRARYGFAGAASTGAERTGRSCP